MVWVWRCFMAPSLQERLRGCGRLVKAGRTRPLGKGESEKDASDSDTLRHFEHAVCVSWWKKTWTITSFKDIMTSPVLQTLM